MLDARWQYPYAAVLQKVNKQRQIETIQAAGRPNGQMDYAT